MKTGSQPIVHARSGVTFNCAAPTLTGKIPDLIKGSEMSGGKVVGGCSP
jgi:hypothetical protein